MENMLFLTLFYFKTLHSYGYLNNCYYVSVLFHVQ